MNRFILISLFILMPLYSCGKDDEVKTGPVEIKLSQEQVGLVNGNNCFGFDLFREIISDEAPEDNVFISPLSVHLALSMAWNGADGTSRQQIRELLNYPDVSDEKINSGLKKLISDLLTVDKRVETGIANSIWYRSGFDVETDFLNVNKNYFNAEVSALDFNSDKSVSIINNWVSEKTNGRIDEIVDQIDPDHIMFLINAIYFKGIWSKEFVKDNTVMRPFYLREGKTKDVMTMETEGAFRYAERDGYRVIELPYGQGNFSMLVFLPDQDGDVEDVTDLLDSGEWNRLSEVMTVNSNVNLRLPRFTFDYDADLKSALIRLGMKDPFNGNVADFTRINKMGDLFISRVRHKSFVEVNEEGTEAAAVTSVEIRLTSAPAEPEITFFHVDRPFVFAIREKFTNSLIFLGRVMEP